MRTSEQSVIRVHILCPHIFADFSANGVISPKYILPEVTIVHPTKWVVRRIASLNLSALFPITLAGMACPSERQAAAPVEGDGAPTITATGMTGSEADRAPSMFHDEVAFGQSAAFTGPARELGKEMRLGIPAAFHEVNRSGGVNGRHLVLETLDDACEIGFAAANTQRLIEKRKVFALIGAVGDPHVSGGIAAGPRGGGAVHRSAHRRRVPAGPGAGQRAELPRLLLSGNPGDGGAAH